MAKKFKCSKCDRSFSMPAHLARHMNTIHATPGQKAAAAAARSRQKGRVRGPGDVAAPSMGRRGRPSSLSTRLGLRDMNLEQLSAVIEAARSEGRLRIQELAQAF